MEELISAYKLRIDQLEKLIQETDSKILLCTYYSELNIMENVTRDIIKSLGRGKKNGESI